MNILITGGAGYIGSYIADCFLKNKNDKVIILDDLSTGHVDGVHKEAKFYEGDIRDSKILDKVFSENKIDIVVHMAAKLNVEESTQKPLYYYDVNVAGTIRVLEAMVKYKVDKIVFSSTAAVYGDGGEEVIYEDAATAPNNPYGISKLQGEEIIIDVAKLHGIRYSIFRYFNVAGGKKPGYDLSYFSSLIPRVICQVRDGAHLEVFGDDYDTVDGTCVRDFIHVSDLAYAHVLGAKVLFESENISNIYNLGTGTGYSVLEIIKAVGRVTNKEVNYSIGARRAGDTVFSVSSNEKAADVLKWKIKVDDINDIISDMWLCNNN